ncbi:MAG: fasciclin domain-containing protein [Akkermansiaceae bacterium]
MKTLLKYTNTTLVVLGISSMPLFAEHHGDKKMGAKKEQVTAADKTVVEIAAADENFSTLVAAVKAAGLAEALSGDGSFTVFAPTNEAFEKLPAGTVEELLKPENKDKLASILKYHVVSGKVMAADVKPMKVMTLQETEFEVTVKEGAVMVDGAKVIKTDIVGKNGVIHVIDSVIMPK